MRRLLASGLVMGLIGCARTLAGPPSVHELTGTGPLEVSPGVCATARMVFDAPPGCSDISIVSIDLTRIMCPASYGQIDNGDKGGF